MTNEKALEILQSVYGKMCSMTEEELFDYMYEKSPSFKEIVDMPDSKTESVSVSVKTEIQNRNADYSLTDDFNFLSAYKTCKSVNDSYTQNITEGDTWQTAA